MSFSENSSGDSVLYRETLVVRVSSPTIPCIFRTTVLVDGGSGDERIRCEGGMDGFKG